MSKGNMLLGHARGKVGDLVFSRTNGQQVVRAKAAVVKNPQTEAQMIQRIILNTVAQAYSKMQPIVDHSYEGVQSGQKTMTAFMAKNLKALRARVSEAVADPTIGLGEVRNFSPVGTNYFVVNNYVISQGSLPSVEAVSSGASTSMTVNLGGTTYGDIISYLGLKRGDQLTFVNVKGVKVDGQTFHYARIILDPTDENGSEADLDTPFIVDGAVYMPSPRNTGAFEALSINELGVLTWAVAGGVNTVLEGAIIVSRKNSDGSWLRSNAQLVANGLNAFYDYTMLICLQMFEQGGIGTLSDMYLNNAGTGRLASASGGAPISVAAHLYDSEAEDWQGEEVTIVGFTTINGGKVGQASNLPALGAVLSDGRVADLRYYNTNSDNHGKLQGASSQYPILAAVYADDGVTRYSPGVLYKPETDAALVNALISAGYPATVVITPWMS